MIISILIHHDRDGFIRRYRLCGLKVCVDEFIGLRWRRQVGSLDHDELTSTQPQEHQGLVRMETQQVRNRGCDGRRGIQTHRCFIASVSADSSAVVSIFEWMHDATVGSRERRRNPRFDVCGECVQGLWMIR